MYKKNIFVCTIRVRVPYHTIPYTMIKNVRPYTWHMEPDVTPSTTTTTDNNTSYINQQNTQTQRQTCALVVSLCRVDIISQCNNKKQMTHHFTQPKEETVFLCLSRQEEKRRSKKKEIKALPCFLPSFLSIEY